MSIRTTRIPFTPSTTYPINDGELPGTVSGDGHPIDACLLGWTGAVQGAWGMVTAVIVRHDDIEDKLVVARDGTRWTDEEVMAAVAFQERRFCTSLRR